MNSHINLSDLVNCIAVLVQKAKLDFKVSYPEKAFALYNGEELWKVNLGTKEMPFWIYGSKEKVFEEYQKFNKQIVESAKDVHIQSNNQGSE